MFSSINVQSKIRPYNIHFISDLDNIITLGNESNTITFVDENVLNLYPILNKISRIYDIPCTESIKSYDGVNDIIDVLAYNKANIKTKIIVIGGGILQDLVGFCASIYCRGIEYTLVPTTLLSMADSCVGGKTSLNYKSRKIYLVRSIHQQIFILILTLHQHWIILIILVG